MASLKYATSLVRPASASKRVITRAYSSGSSSPASPATSPFAPRHFLSIADLTPAEVTTLVRNGFAHKQSVKTSGTVAPSLRASLTGKTVAMPFSKRSTRTRVSTEAAVVHMGGHPMFLSSADIQLGVNENLYDTSVVVSSMAHAIVARVGPHSDIAELAKHSSVPVINALSDAFHPLQTIADFLTIHETFGSSSSGAGSSDLGLGGMKIAWVGDANNVLFDLALAAGKLGVHMSVATPTGFEIPAAMRELIESSTASAGTGATLSTTRVPEEAVRDADIIVTDTWVSMGQEAEKADRLRQFAGFQVTAELASRGGAREGWKFMHCLPRKPEEVSDDVFYNPQRSLVFPEAENRVYSALSAIEAFVVNRGDIKPTASS